MTKKKPEVIRVSNLAKTLEVIEVMVEDMDREFKVGGEWVIRLLRKHYGIEEE